MLWRAAILAAAVVAAPAQAATTTSYATIEGDPDKPYSTLRQGAGWKRVVRTDLAAAQRNRSLRRRSLLYFAQLSDFQLADEESPARVESLDLDSTPFTAAWRPQEAMVPHTVDQVLRQLNRFLRSPLRSRRRPGRKRFARLALAILTGDNADNQQINETQWVVRLLEGGRLDPNSGIEAPCAPGQDPRRYHGVQRGPGFYDPDAPSGTFAAFPAWPGLMDRAQVPFEAAGLKVPSYVALGNHDGSVQGNVAAHQGYQEIAVGCVKPLQFSTGGGPTALLAPALRSSVVPPDPARGFASRAKYMELHRTGAQADAHGFAFVDEAERRASAGHATYYSWVPRTGLRFVSINTVGEGSNAPGSEGNLDHPQFQWLERTIKEAAARKEMVVVFGHHPIRSLSNSDADESARDCSDASAGPGCDGDPRPSAPIHHGADLQALLTANRNVVAFVAGHTHEHKITPFKRQDGGGFWGIETASEVDWPIQSRLLEIMDNRDGTVSIYGTVLDHAAPLRAPAPGAAGAFSPEQLASIARELSYNDPQGGAPGGTGKPEDRNVELLVPFPYVRGS